MSIKLPLELNKLPIIVLTHSENSIRKQIMIEQLNKMNLSAEYFDNSGYNATNGHIRIIEKLKNENIPYCLILEDDACFMKKFIELYPLIIKELNNINDWDLFYFGGNLLNKISKKISSLIIQPNMIYCNHAYIICNKSYDITLYWLQKSEFNNLVVDDIYTRSDLKILASNELLVSQLSPGFLFDDCLYIHKIMEESYKKHI